MANDTSLSANEKMMVWVPLVLAVLGAGAEMFGEFLREIAVLVVVFVPLEMWKTQKDPELGVMIWRTLWSSMAFLAAGMLGKYFSMAMFRIKRDLEGKDGN